MASFFTKLIGIGKSISPNWLIRRIKNKITFQEWETESWEKTNPYIKDSDEFHFENSRIKAGILYNTMQYHKHWIAACRELQISYQIIYFEKPDWLEQIKQAACNVFLVWPDIRTQEIKQMWDERLQIMVEEMNCQIFPSLKEVWLYENKRTQNYWLEAHGFRTPATWIFYNLKDALKFLDTASYPIVMKSNLGASASGVYIIYTRKEALQKAKKFIKYGYSPKRNAAGKKQKGSIYIQEYLPNVKEWRMVRIGNSYFGHGKDLNGHFHSGSGKANYNLPPKNAFKLLQEITEAGSFYSMDVDLFEDSGGNLYVNELQTVFGTRIAKEQMKIDNVPGRYVTGENNDFTFEEGNFCRNHMCNLRLQFILENNETV